MTQVTNQPLYKRLNEQRTQGDWITKQCRQFSNYTDIFINEKHVLSLASENASDTEAKANAQYTALAVNELANLAEALELLKANFEANKKFGTLPNQQELEAGLSIINKALNRIS